MDKFAGDFVFAAFGDEAVPSDGFHAGEGEVCADAEFGDDGLFFSVFGDEGCAETFHVADAGAREGAPVQDDLAVVKRICAEDGAEEFGAAGAEHAGDSEDFAAMEGEVDVVEFIFAGKIADFEERLGRGLKGLGALVLDDGAEDHSDD